MRTDALASRPRRTPHSRCQRERRAEQDHVGHVRQRHIFVSSVDSNSILRLRVSPVCACRWRVRCRRWRGSSNRGQWHAGAAIAGDSRSSTRKAHAPQRAQGEGAPRGPGSMAGNRATLQLQPRPRKSPRPWTAGCRFSSARKRPNSWRNASGPRAVRRAAHRRDQICNSFSCDNDLPRAWPTPRYSSAAAVSSSG